MSLVSPIQPHCRRCLAKSPLTRARVGGADALLPKVHQEGDHPPLPHLLQTTAPAMSPSATAVRCSLLHTTAALGMASLPRSRRKSVDRPTPFGTRDRFWIVDVNTLETRNALLLTGRLGASAGLSDGRSPRSWHSVTAGPSACPNSWLSGASALGTRIGRHRATVTIPQALSSVQRPMNGDESGVRRGRRSRSVIGLAPDE